MRVAAWTAPHVDVAGMTGSSESRWRADLGMDERRVELSCGVGQSVADERHLRHN